MELRRSKGRYADENLADVLNVVPQS